MSRYENSSVRSVPARRERRKQHQPRSVEHVVGEYDAVHQAIAVQVPAISAPPAILSHDNLNNSFDALVNVVRSGFVTGVAVKLAWTTVMWFFLPPAQDDGAPFVVLVTRGLSRDDRLFVFAARAGADPVACGVFSDFGNPDLRVAFFRTT